MSDQIPPKSTDDFKRVNPCGIIESAEERAARERTEYERERKNNDQLLLSLHQRQTEAQQSQARASNVIVTLTAGLVFVSLIGGFVSYLQFSAARRSADAAREAVSVARDTLTQSKIAWDQAEKSRRASDAASAEQNRKTLESSIAISRNDQRAWVGVISITGANYQETVNGVQRAVYLKAGEAVSVGAELHNSGKSIAKDVKSCVTFDVVSSKDKFTPRSCTPQEQAFVVIQPGASGSVSSATRAGFSATTEILEALRSGVTVCYFYGWITYNDVWTPPFL